MRGIYFNSIKALCSIWESGKMVYDILSQSNKYNIDYKEGYCLPDNIMDYDFIVVNYHYVVNKWITKDILNALGKPSYCIITEIGLDKDNLFCCTPKIFNHYLFLDPTIEESNTIHAFPRPLDYGIDLNDCVNEPNIPTIGSFGFATIGKAWHEIIRAVCNEFDKAIIKFNIPKATYVTDIMFTKEIINIKKLCKPMLEANPNIKLLITHDVMNKTELVNWCAGNTINCFFYDRYTVGFRAGLCAVTDQAILSDRPLLTSADPTFRHITKYINPYPIQTIREAISTTGDIVKQIRDDWSHYKFLSKFEAILLG
jgi:hypothetical protein